MPRAVWGYLFAAFGILWGAFFLRGAVDWPAAVDGTLRMVVKFGPSLAGVFAAFRLSGLSGISDVFARLFSKRIPYYMTKLYDETI